MENIPDLRQWEVFTNQNCHPVETKAVRLAVVFAQSEFGFFERSYHCKHGAFPAAAVALAFQSRLLPRLSPARISLYTLFVIPRKGATIWLPFRCTTSSFFRSLTHSVPIFVLSKAALTQRTRNLGEGGSYWTTAVNAAASKFRLPNAA